MGSHVCPGTPRQQRKAKETWGPYLQAQKKEPQVVLQKILGPQVFRVVRQHSAWLPLPTLSSLQCGENGPLLQDLGSKVRLLNGFTSSNNDECHLPGSHHLHPLGISWGLRMRATIQFCETKRCRHAKQKETGCA